MATVNDLCEAIDGLDQWISRGGFLPTPWVPQPAPGTGEAISSDAALAQLRTAMSVYEDVRGNGTGCHLVDKSADQMRDAGRSLDDWLTRGGSLPQPWAKSRATQSRAATPIPDSGLHAAADALKRHLAAGGSVNDPAWMRPQRAPRYQCKLCGAESPVGIGYVLAPGVEPSQAQPAPDCPNQHV